MNAKRVLVFDGLLTVVFVVSLFPGITTVAGHEWLGLVAVLAFIAHFAIHLRSFSDRTGLYMANLCVDGLEFVTLAVCAVSGLLMSGTVLPTFGLYAEGYFYWNPLHAIAAKTLLALVVVHLALHVRFVTGVLRIGSKSAPLGERLQETSGAKESKPTH